MKISFSIFYLVTLFLSLKAYSIELKCKSIYSIQKQFLKHHVLYAKHTKELKNRTLNGFIKNLDREKVYFLDSDIQNIKRKNKRLFSNLKKGNCSGLYYIYNIYSKRVKERILYAQNLLHKDFEFSKNTKYVLDKKLKKWPKNSNQANQYMKAYTQYLVANVFLFEKNLKKSTDQVSHIFNKNKKQVLSWKPLLNPMEKRHCKEKSKGSFKVCKPKKWFSNYLNAYSQSLDSHSSYLDNEDMEEFKIHMHLQLEGIGATLSSRFGYTIVERLVQGGAAFNSKKLKIKDKILEVGQKSDKMINIFGERIEDVVSIIRGKKGTSVFLKILREEKNGKNSTFIIKLVRDKIDLKEEGASISYHNKKINQKTYKIGLLKVPSFYGSSSYFGKSVSSDVKKLLISARKKNIDALVLDLSNNRGGSLDEAVTLSGLFFASGNVVKQSGKYKTDSEILKDIDNKVFYEGPLVVLTNRLSASASEIVAGTLQDYKRAVIVGGDSTFGKGSVQAVEPLFSLGALKTTVGLYFIPSGKSTQKIGVSSDIVLPSLLNIEQLGEKNLEYTLPSKIIKSFKSPENEIFSSNKNRVWKPINKNLIKELNKKSNKRIKKNKEFQKIHVFLTKKMKKKTEKAETTIAEVLNTKGLDQEERSKKTDLTLNFEENKKKYFERPDILEAIRISIDLSLLLKKYKSAKNKL